LRHCHGFSPFPYVGAVNMAALQAAIFTAPRKTLRTAAGSEDSERHAHGINYHSLPKQHVSF
jgi:hypothetical protein